MGNTRCRLMSAFSGEKQIKVLELPDAGQPTVPREQEWEEHQPIANVDSWHQTASEKEDEQY